MTMNKGKTGKECKLLRTIKNFGGDVFRKGSIVYFEKGYGGYTLTKKRGVKCRIKGTNEEYFNRTVSVKRVNKEDFEII